jgi:hypothetical protein
MEESSFFEQLVREYYNEKYQEMSQVLIKTGLVKDIIDEIKKYINLETYSIGTHGSPMEDALRKYMWRPQLEDLYAYYYFHPFNSEEYYIHYNSIVGPIINMALPTSLFPGAKEIFYNDRSNIVYHGVECYAEGTCMVSYKDYIIVYEYAQQLSEEDMSLLIIVFEEFEKAHESLLYVIRNFFTVYKKEEFDYMKYLKEEMKTFNMEIIFPVIKFFSHSDEYRTNMDAMMQHMEEKLSKS